MDIFIFLAGAFVGWTFLDFLAEMRMRRKIHKIRSIQLEQEQKEFDG